MINWLLSILVTKKVITEEEAQHLAKELVLRTHPHGFDDAHKIVTEVLADLKKSK